MITVFLKKGVMSMVMPEVLQNLSGYVNDVSNLITSVLTPVIGLIFAVSALVIVVGCVSSAIDHVMHLRRKREVLSAINLGADLVVASVLVSLVTATGSLNVLYLVATAAIAVSVRMGVAKLSK
jgi:hypothetical protein